MRERFGLTSSEMEEEAIGYSSDEGRTVRNLEVGAKNGRVFSMTGPAAMSLHRMVTAHQALIMLRAGRFEDADALLRSILPERLR